MMNKEDIKDWINNFFLCKKYPFLRIKNNWTHKKSGYQMTELDMLPHGWKKAFGLNICEDLDALFKKSKTKNFAKKYHITQIKEKYGSLRWYDNGVPQDILDEYLVIIEKYGKISSVTCMDCGKSATMRCLCGWYEPLCDDCYNEFYNKKEESKNE